VSKRLAVLIAALFALAVTVAACGGGSSSGGGGGGGGGGSTSQGSVSGAKVIDPNSMNNAKGSVTYCTGKDTSGDLKTGIVEFNKENPNIKAKLLEFPEQADQQHDQFAQRERAKRPDCDVFESDVVWTAEFAQQKWLYDMTPYIQSRTSDFIPSTLESIHYAGKYWGVPHSTDTGLLYYRSDQVPTPPSTWQDLYNTAKSKNGVVYQGASYEGLTCNFLELAFAAGGQVLSADGKKSVINSPENVKALQFMAQGIKDGAAPKAVTTMMEEDARRAFESGKATFERNWPYAYALGNMAPKIKGKFKVAPLPAFQGGGKAGILGGHNFVVSAFSKNPGAALKLVDFFTHPKWQKVTGIKYSKAPVLKSVYDDPAYKKAIPFASVLSQGVAQAHTRPVSPVYPQISQAIYKNVNQALSGQVSPQDALKAADSQINRALQTF
jgi:multiple sugar transport system substrate-binding protein